MKRLLIVLGLLMIFTGCKEASTTNNIKTNNNENIIKEQVVGNLLLNQVSLTYEKGTSTFSVQITNQTSESVAINQFDVTFKTKNGSVIATLQGTLGDSLDGNTSIVITMTSDIDLTEAYSLEYNIS
jgi:lipoprotein